MIELFPQQKIPYFICSPSYTHTSSGVRTLHLLCHALNEAGQLAYLIADKAEGYATNPALNTPLLQPQHHNFYQTSGIHPIVVYPDITRGNPLNCKKVVRYLLAPAGAYGGDATFPETDNVWGALPSIAGKVLRLPVSDPNIFYPLNPYWPISRESTCFYSHKYEMHGNELLDITSESTRLCGTLEEIAEILRRSKACYLYEVSSILTEAALCGCPVTLVRTPYFKKIDPECMMGEVKWSDGEIVKWCTDYHTQYQQVMNNFGANLQEFIRDTQAMI